MNSNSMMETIEIKLLMIMIKTKKALMLDMDKRIEAKRGKEELEEIDLMANLLIQTLIQEKELQESTKLISFTQKINMPFKIKIMMATI